MSQLISGTPVRHPLVQRIENCIATLGAIELRRVVECRVVDNGRLTAFFDLLHDSSNQSAFAGAGVTHNKDVVGFDGERESDARHNSEQLLQECFFRQLKADAVRTIPAIESPGVTSSGPLSLRPSLRSRARAASFGIATARQTKSTTKPPHNAGLRKSMSV